MRLSEIRMILKENMEALTLKAERSKDGQFYSMCGIASAMKAVENVAKVPSLEPLARKIQGMRAVSSIWSDEAASIPMASAEDFQNHLGRLKNECRIIISLADSILPKAHENLLCVRLSETITDISDLKGLVDALEKAFQYTAGMKNYPGHVRFAGVEAGTNWLNLIIDGAPYAALLYLLIQAAYEAVRDYYELMALRKKHSSIDALCQVTDSNASLVRELNESILSRLRDDGSLSVSSEEFAKLCKASLCFSQIVMEGNKVLLSIEAPKEKQDCILDAVKEIEARASEIKELDAPKAPDAKDS